MNVLLLASHAVAEFDDVRMLHNLGYDVFAPGGYEVPSHSGEGIRPALPQVPYHADLHEACERVRGLMGPPGPSIDWAKAHIPDEVLDWADVIIVHHFPERWIGGQWERIKHKRVIWRTCGQSSPELEAHMADFDCEVVRYSPNERIHFGDVRQDALIRFGKYPDDYGPWVGDTLSVGNVTQHMAQRGDACGYAYWEAATEGLPVTPAGPGSEVLRGGVGSLPYPNMLLYLAHLRAYLYTGTRPAPYTLGLIEAALSGVPIVSIGPRAWGGDWGATDLFEAWELGSAGGPSFDDPKVANAKLRIYLEDEQRARTAGFLTRDKAIRLFGIETVGPQWKAFLG